MSKRMQETGTTVELRSVDRNNVFDVLKLKVAEGQARYVASNAVSLAQAYAFPECVPLAVYAGGVLVGFVMYALDEDDREYCVYRLMVDEKHQGHGFGRKALQAVIGLVQGMEGRRKLYLSVEPENEGAIHVYKALGFAFDGREVDGEHVMLLQW